MSDDHLIAPPDSDLPSRRVGVGVMVGALLAWGIALAAADRLRGSEVRASATARALDPATLGSAPPARFPGGVDQRSLDPSAQRNAHGTGAADRPRGPVHGPEAPPPHRAGPPPSSGRPAEPTAPPEPR